jgi:lipoprotein-anchoring transpeptidase ErfK/SrfK
MNRAQDFVRISALALPVPARLRPAAIAIAGFIVLLVAWFAAQVVVLEHSASVAVNASVARVTTPWRPDEAIQITVQGAGVQVEGAHLFRAEVAADGSRGSEQAVPVRLQPTGDAGSWQVISGDAGAPVLAADGAYRLVVRIAAPRPALPMPRTEIVDQQYRFTTIASPHADVPAGVLQPRWAEPVSFTWSTHMSAISATVEPAAPVRTWVDSRDPKRTWVQLGDDNDIGLTDGQTYIVRIADARASDGLTLQRPVSFSVAVPARPRFVDPPTAPVMLRYGDSLTLKSTMDMANVQVTTSTSDQDVPAQVHVGRNDIRLALPEYRQGAQFDLNVLSATSILGAPLAQPLNVRVATPPAFDAPTLQPADGSIGIQPTAHPSIAFAEPVADPAAATRALQIDPLVAGHWTWTANNQKAEFVPHGQLPLLTSLTLSVRGGPDGPRTAAGGYLDGDVSASFTTTDFKRMDVSLSRQTMTLYEHDRPIRTIYVATGVAAAPTPTGKYYVQYKSAQMRFRGVNPDGTQYDIADVHWVMPFWGDYTIHGAYWRGRFGAPGSAGCVSMSDADAKSLFDWADVGTPIVIHS